MFTFVCSFQKAKAHFLNDGKWDDTLLADRLKATVIDLIYSEARRTGQAVYCIVDDTITSKTKRFLSLLCYGYIRTILAAGCQSIFLYKIPNFKILMARKIGKNVLNGILSDCIYHIQNVHCFILIHFAEILFAISLRIASISVSGGLTGEVGFHAGSWLDVSSASINFSAFFGSLITMFVKILDVAIYNTSCSYYLALSSYSSTFSFILYPPFDKKSAAQPYV